MRLVIVMVRASRQVVKFIRGYHAELQDSALADTIGAEEPEPIAIDGGRAGVTWQRPRISQPDANGVRWAVWGVWADTVPLAAQDRLRALATQFPTHVKIHFQRTGQGETLDAFLARWRTESGWPGDPVPAP